MKSHTVPCKLLEQFSYVDPRTKSLRLWRYEKDLPPYPKASPRTATRIDGHFNHPDIAAKEEELEIRLNREIETPVNEFLSRITDQSFIFTDEHRRKLTRYVTLLFTRSKARRDATRHYHRVSIHALNKFLGNESQVLTVAVKHSIDLFLAGQSPWLLTPDVVRTAARDLIQSYETERKRQASYAESVERGLLLFEDSLYSGQWRLLQTTASDPFIISDAPVVTWERIDGSGTFSYGVGFQRTNVELLLPISSCVCLHILPNVERTRSVEQPTTREVNIAQAAFAREYCFASVRSGDIDQIVKQNIGKAKLGVTALTVWHRNYDNAVYEILMNDGHWVTPPRR